MLLGSEASHTSSADCILSFAFKLCNIAENLVPSSRKALDLAAYRRVAATGLLCLGCGCFDWAVPGMCLNRG